MSEATPLPYGLDPERLYRSSELSHIASDVQLTMWRHRGGGPRFTILGKRCIRYRGSEVIKYLDERTVDTHPPKNEGRKAARQAAAAPA